MRNSALSPRIAVLALAPLLLLGTPVRAQIVVSPRAPSAAAASTSPISPFLFGPPAYPFRATAPSSYRGASQPDQAVGGGIYRGPSLSTAPAPQASSLSFPMQNQLRIGAFVGFAPLSSLALSDSTSSLPGGNYSQKPDNSAHLTLRVPADAQVWFDGKATKQTGTVRMFTTPPLPIGKTFVYEVRARWMKDGEPIEEKRRIKVEAKDWLRFDLRQPSDQ